MLIIHEKARGDLMGYFTHTHDNLNAVADQWRIVRLSFVDPKQQCPSCLYRTDDARQRQAGRF